MVYYAVVSEEDIIYNNLEFVINAWITCYSMIESHDPNRIVMDLKDRYPRKWIVNAWFFDANGQQVHFDTTVAENFIPRALFVRGKPSEG